MSGDGTRNEASPQEGTFRVVVCVGTGDYPSAPTVPRLRLPSCGRRRLRGCGRVAPPCRDTTNRDADRGRSSRIGDEAGYSSSGISDSRTPKATRCFLQSACMEPLELRTKNIARSSHVLNWHRTDSTANRLTLMGRCRAMSHCRKVNNWESSQNSQVGDKQ